ncbi:ADP-ribosylglycohydrolase family protein [Solibacillus sp. FSL W8-0474]|uniref:ADP-ribosylglycohydrolase family protein n=1 Tax=Solibacillus sp. FSL W8-0474 TaxID=2975336 RepID=UPI0030F62AED
MIPTNYVDKVYASILAMNAGIRLGAPVEPTEWTPEVIADVFGDIRNYVKDYTVFSADDDANGPIFFLRAFLDYAKDNQLQPEHMEKTWLNYMREGLGMIWWGGDQISTEHTAYLNLRRGIKAPKSGSIEVNGKLLAEQIGGQIFIDFFGLLFPNNPEKAADFAEITASVSHDGEGLYGARFIAACIASAFTEKPMRAIIADGLNEIPSESTYTKVVEAVLDFHKEHPDDFYACREYLENNWGYDKYGGICHIIPNAGVCVLALLYGQGDVSRTIEIATMCGWDTDCNAGNVGSIVGVLNGLQGIADHYRKPINDAIVTSSVSGYLNIVDLPTLTKQVALIGYRLNDEVAPEALVQSYKETDIYLDFTLPGSTHGFKTNYPFKTFLRHSSEGYRTAGSLEIFLDRMYEGDESTLYYQSFYRRKQFMDEKYAPTFSPTAYSGQTVSMYVKIDQYQGEPVIATPYIKTTTTEQKIFTSTPIELISEWQQIEFVIPDTNGEFIEEVGIHLYSNSDKTCRAFGKVYVDEFHITGTPSYSIDFNKQSIEFRSVTGFAHHRGQWSLQDNQLVMTSETDASSYTGHYYLKNADVKLMMKPLAGHSHHLILRAQGIERYYRLGFENTNELAIVVKDHSDVHVLANTPFTLELGRQYTVEASAVGNKLTLAIDGTVYLEVEDDRFATGMVGVGTATGGSCEYGTIHVNS